MTAADSLFPRRLASEADHEVGIHCDPNRLSRRSVFRARTWRTSSERAVNGAGRAVRDGFRNGLDAPLSQSATGRTPTLPR
ncbi:hypothetical protein [Streptomyces sp. AK02-01A]|uniref:hypothetical protein n=1 Tax=Streptomyces sp. AK02-01A TaxID=3028648 RepID=UPI0029BB1413|nr:hypothetical protein [Streptomyces sp. AK02-01A]MDX3853172.1 hypothetical protein [Streptomyces sp. AK02-01A]